MNREIVKLVITGPVNVGKSTLIRHLSDTPVICTDEIATDEVADVKKYTTVAMDHGLLHVDEGLEMHLYGTPGQRRFDFMWDILAEGSVGIIYLVDASDPDSIEETKYIYHHFRERLTVPGIVGVTKLDVGGAISVREVSQCLDVDSLPVMGCDPREKKDSKVLVLSLLDVIMQNREVFVESEFF